MMPRRALQAGRAFVVGVAGIRLVIRIGRERRTSRCGDKRKIIAYHCVFGWPCSPLRLIAAGYTAALAFEPLCSVFRSTRHYAGKPAVHSTTPATTATPTSVAEHP